MTARYGFQGQRQLCKDAGYRIPCSIAPAVQQRSQLLEGLLLQLFRLQGRDLYAVLHIRGGGAQHGEGSHVEGSTYREHDLPLRGVDPMALRWQVRVALTTGCTTMPLWPKLFHG